MKDFILEYREYQNHNPTQKPIPIPMPTVKPVKFLYRGTEGDFGYMIKRPEYQNTLFIFNDNEEHHHTNLASGGNACIRCYNKYRIDGKKPLAAGIPTGLNGKGYSQLDSRTRKVINTAVREIEDLIMRYKYDQILYSCSPDGYLLGTGIFSVSMPVLEYITIKINDLKDLEDTYIF